MRPLLLTCSLLAATAMAPCRAATPDNFAVRSGADLLAVCSTEPSDNSSSAAIGFCHGYIVGVYRVLEEIQEARPSARMFCMASTPPNRTEAIKAYVAWLGASPDELTKPPMVTIADYLTVTYPCPAGNKPGRPAGARTSK